MSEKRKKNFIKPVRNSKNNLICNNNINGNKNIRNKFKYSSFQFLNYIFKDTQVIFV